ncbi:hypothetical protein SAMN05421788_1154 [Filimonas lacunae]|uniref:Addiction module component n=1 Tax=Filimonas lacunae TaxID=477680 RepID=A0A173MC97_9BACT|nr:hypothetical protein [Filimonas lacunae]BAV05156.1 hypothetical protein FLA_1163 [Filimonas lacunae]SIT34143.1 hypothetical protein SAMN05421788_1154 [Filimonas lacunae]
MAVDPLTYNISDKVISIQDVALLEKINDLIGMVDLEKTTFNISPRQKEMLHGSMEDIKNGRLISDEELNREEQEWLNG